MADVQLSTLGATIKQALLGHDGSGSLVDADLLDGQHASAFATAAQGEIAENALQKSQLVAGTLTPAPGGLNLGGGSDGHVLTKQADGSIALEMLPTGSAAVSSIFGRTGDVVAQAGDYTAAQVIGPAAVTSAMLRNSTALTLIGRAANSAGVPGDIPATAGSGAVLRENGSLLGFGTVATAGLADDAVTYAKLQNVSAASRLLGRGSAAGAGNAEEITLDSSLTMTGTVLSASGGGGSVTAPADFTATGTPSGTTFLRGDNVWAVPPGTAGGSAGIIDGAVIFAEDFGANPNGTTDCASAINAAILEASNYTVAGQRRGGVVQLLKGTYRIQSTVLLRSLCELRGISPTATTLWVPSNTNIRAVQTFNTDQILYGVRSFGVYGNAANQTADNGSGTLTGSPGSDTGGVYLLNAKAEPSAIGEYVFLGGCRSWARDLLIQEVAGNGFVCQGNSGWQVDHINVRWARRYGLYIDTNDGSFEQMVASRTGWAGMFVDGASNRISNIKLWFNGVEMDKWAAAKTWTATNDTTANSRQFSTNQKAGCGVLVRGDRNRIVLVDTQDTAGHGAYVQGRFNWVEITCDQVGQVNAGGTTTRYDGGGAGAFDWVDLNPSTPLVGVYCQQNQRGVLKAFVHDINYNNDGTPGGSVLHHALQHLVRNDEVDLTLDVYGHQEIPQQRVPPTASVVSAAPAYTLNGIAFSATSNTGTKTYASTDSGRDFRLTGGTQTFGAAAGFPADFSVNLFRETTGTVTIDGIDADYTISGPDAVTVKKVGTALMAVGKAGVVVLDAA